MKSALVTAMLFSSFAFAGEIVTIEKTVSIPTDIVYDSPPAQVRKSGEESKKKAGELLKTTIKEIKAQHREVDLLSVESEFTYQGPGKDEFVFKIKAYID